MTILWMSIHKIVVFCIRREVSFYINYWLSLKDKLCTQNLKLNVSIICCLFRFLNKKKRTRKKYIDKSLIFSEIEKKARFYWNFKKTTYLLAYRIHNSSVANMQSYFRNEIFCLWQNIQARQNEISRPLQRKG